MIISASLRQAAACRHKATVEPLMIYIAAMDDVTAVIGFLHHATSNGQIIIPNVDDARHDLTAAPEIITFSAASD
jgi:hypothetical protein